MRGAMTVKIKEVSKKFLGVEITQSELRLMPYIQFTMMNNQKIDPNRISEEERRILSKWRLAGWIEGGASEMSITKDFWDALNEILWFGYVAHRHEETQMMREA